MTELDLMNATRDSVSATNGHLMSFVTGLFAMLAASHFAGAQLSKPSVRILVGIFSVFSLITGATTLGTIGEAQALAEVLARIPDPELPRPPIAFFGPMRLIVGLVLVAGYLAGLAFLRECRKRTDSGDGDPPDA